MDENYHIPKDIKVKIPEYFYLALGRELVSIFGETVLLTDEDGVAELDYVTSTAGYAEALREACKKLDMNWLYDYWNSLDWHESDLFDSEIVDEIEKCFADNKLTNLSYLHLIKSQKGTTDND